MIEKKHRALASIYLVNDAVASNLAMLTAWLLRFYFEVIPVTKGQQDLITYVKLLPIVTIVFPVAFAVQGLYRIRQVRGKGEEWIAVAIGSVVATVIFSGVLLWVRPGSPDALYSRATLAIFLGCVITFVIFGRMLVRAVLEARHRAGRDLDRVLIAGNGELARAVVERVNAHRERLGFAIVGYLRNGHEGAIAGLECLGSLDDAESVVRKHEIEHVFVALPHESAHAMTALLDRLVRNPVSIHVVPDLLQFMVLRSRVEDLDGLPTINLSETPLEGWSRFVKRAFDLLVAIAALIVVSPVMLAIALLIWLEDRGPVFYKQVRMGLDGKPFEIFKFRSMRVAAEAESGAVWAHRDDPRRTRIGSFIRAWFPEYMLRHKVRAGMTGWAQVHGWRGNTSIRMRIEHDLYYIQNWSLLLDVKILFMTVVHGLKHENAY
jgi:lipopolysaccharide/colanic/teichoic acid biosynthesis glycosyltransferase